MAREVLSQAQKKIIAHVGQEPFFTDFYLTGGTALSAFYLQHRISNDLDFFSFRDSDTAFIRHFVDRIKQELACNDVRFERLYDRNIYFFQCASEEFKIEFAKYPFLQLEQPQVKDGIKIDSLRDIAANKLAAILDRFDPKDFVDLFFILRTRKLKEIWSDSERKFGAKIDPLFLGGELMKSQRIEALPSMIEPLDIVELKAAFREHAEEMRPSVFQ